MRRFELFIEASVLLSGFDRAELLATGMGETYYNTVLKNTETEFITYFFQDFELLLTSLKTKEEIDTILSTQFMPDSNYGGLAKNIILLWYTGNWNNHIISSASYIQGLMWEAGHTHPPGAKQPGFGSWAEKPFSVK